MRTLLLCFLLVLAVVPAAAQPAADPPRELFLFLYRPGPAWVAGRPMNQQNLRPHAEYHAMLVREGRSVAGGGFVGREEGMAIVRAANLAEAEAMLAADPAIQNGVFAAEIRHWRPRFHSDRPLVETAR